MSDNKKYYYLKLKEDFFTSETIILLESMKDGVMYSNILLKLYLMSLKNNGKLIFRDNIPYTTEMIATITRHQTGTIERAINIFLELELIDQLPDNILYMADIELFIGKSSTEGERKRRARLENKKKLIALTDNCPPEYRDKRIEGIEKDQMSSTPFYGQFKNVKLSGEEYKKLEEELKDHTKIMVDKLSRYMESSGKDYKNHYVTILNWYEEDKNKLINKSDKRKTTSNYDDSPSI
ncbi:phage replisome organizer N-terminal domain-containing protein [Facklamia sp. P12945]|uniref:phage replisome organizer N-terminal domain-containing protein n=1 Tax=Facklamia sp. P12945 TaxID=3421950 RepID=UPI003D172C2D